MPAAWAAGQFCARKWPQTARAGAKENDHPRPRVRLVESYAAYNFNSRLRAGFLAITTSDTQLSRAAAFARERSLEPRLTLPKRNGMVAAARDEQPSVGKGVTAQMSPSEPIGSPRLCPFKSSEARTPLGAARSEGVGPPDRGDHLVALLKVEDGGEIGSFLKYSGRAMSSRSRLVGNTSLSASVRMLAKERL
jgi:hypothetical protein